MNQSYEFLYTESCIKDMHHHFKKRRLSPKEWGDMDYRCKLEAQNIGVFGNWHRSERIMGIDEYHIRRIRNGDWRLIFHVLLK